MDGKRSFYQVLVPSRSCGALCDGPDEQGRDPTLQRIRYQPYVAMREWREIHRSILWAATGKNIKGPRTRPGRHAGLTVEVVVHPADIQDD